VGPDGRVLGSGSNLADLRALGEEKFEDHLLEDARRKWERTGLVSWDFGDVPGAVDLGRDTLGLARFAYPGLVSEGQTVALRLFGNPEEAEQVSQNGLMTLYQLTFATELKQLRRMWVFPESMTSMIFFMGSRIEADRQLQGYLMREIFNLHGPQRPERELFELTVQSLRGKLGALGREMIEEVFDVLRERDFTRRALERFRNMAEGNRAVLERMGMMLEEMDRIVPKDFLLHLGRAQVAQLPRYLKALKLRAERAYVSPEKDRIKVEQLVLHQGRLEGMQKEASEWSAGEGRDLVDEFRWMLEEYKVSLFAPEVRTLYKISAKRLEEKWQEWLLWKTKRG
jgi:ATP-dependent helicase HrpA